MNKKLPPFILSWDQLESLGNELGKIIKESGFEPECLIGISVGGLVPLALLSRKLKIQDVATISARSYNKNTKEQEKLLISNMPQIDVEGKRVLLVDEIVDSGETLKAIMQKLSETYRIGELKTATLVVNTAHCTIYPDFFVLKVDRWVNFPWEEKIV